MFLLLVVLVPPPLSNFIPPLWMEIPLIKNVLSSKWLIYILSIVLFLVSTALYLGVYLKVSSLRNNEAMLLHSGLMAFEMEIGIVNNYISF